MTDRHALYALVADGREMSFDHAACELLEFCRNPLHPGPCKGWKHTLHTIAPGLHARLEQERLGRVNARRAARVKEFEAAGKVAPRHLVGDLKPKAVERVELPNELDKIKTADKIRGEVNARHAEQAVKPHAAPVNTTINAAGLKHGDQVFYHGHEHRTDDGGENWQTIHHTNGTLARVESGRTANSIVDAKTGQVLASSGKSGKHLLSPAPGKTFAEPKAKGEPGVPAGHTKYTHTLPDGTTETRTSKRPYTHVVEVQEDAKQLVAEQRTLLATAKERLKTLPDQKPRWEKDIAEHEAKIKDLESGPAKVHYVSRWSSSAAAAQSHANELTKRSSDGSHRPMDHATVKPLSGSVDGGAGSGRTDGLSATQGDLKDKVASGSHMLIHNPKEPGTTRWMLHPKEGKGFGKGSSVKPTADALATRGVIEKKKDLAGGAEAWGVKDETPDGQLPAEKAALASIRDLAGKGGDEHGYVSIADLRDELDKKGFDRKTQDEALQVMAKGGYKHASLIPIANKKSLTQRERDGALKMEGDDDVSAVRLRRPDENAAVEEKVASREETSAKAITATAAGLSTDHGQSDTAIHLSLIANRLQAGQVTHDGAVTALKQLHGEAPAGAERDAVAAAIAKVGGGEVMHPSLATWHAGGEAKDKMGLGQLDEATKAARASGDENTAKAIERAVSVRAESQRKRRGEAGATGGKAEIGSAVTVSNHMGNYIVRGHNSDGTVKLENASKPGTFKDVDASKIKSLDEASQKHVLGTHAAKRATKSSPALGKWHEGGDTRDGMTMAEVNQAADAARLGGNPALGAEIDRKGARMRLEARTKLRPAGGGSPASETPKEGTPEAVHAAISEAYQAAEAEAKKNGATDGWMNMEDVRKHLGDRFPRAQVDRELKNLSVQPGVTIAPENNQKTLTDAQRAAAVRIGNQDKHLIHIDKSRHQDLAGGATPAATKAVDASDFGASQKVKAAEVMYGTDRSKWPKRALGDLAALEKRNQASPGKADNPTGGVVERATGNGAPTVHSAGAGALKAAPVRVANGKLSTAPAGWSDERKDAAAEGLEHYRDIGFSDLNRDLRAGTPSSTTGKRAVAQIDDVMAASPLRSPVLTFRGIGNVTEMFGAGPLTGKEITDPAYSSTTVDLKTAKGFAGNQGAVLRMRVPAGVGGVQLSDVAGGGKADDREGELLLQRGLRYRVVGDSTIEGQRVLDVEVEPTAVVPVAAPAASRRKAPAGPPKLNRNRFSLYGLE